MRDKQEKLTVYVQALPGILQYQLFTKLVLGVWLFRRGRPAPTSSPTVMRNWTYHALPTAK